MKPATHPNEDPAWMPTPAASAEARVSLRFVAGISVSLVVHGLLLGLLLLQQGGGGETAAQATSPLLVEWQVADPVPVPLPRVEPPVPQPEAAPMSRAAPAAARDDAAAALAVSDAPAPEPLHVAQRAPNAASRSSEDASESLPTPTPTPATSAAASAADAYVWDVLHTCGASSTTRSAPASAMSRARSGCARGCRVAAWCCAPTSSAVPAMTCSTAPPRA